MLEEVKTVTLLTDFGAKDSFIGIMKGVITSIAPGTVIIDLCHEVEAQNIIEAGFLLASSYSYFPAGTIHVAVVDPGVGTERSILVIKAKGYYFVVPDNGIIVPSLSSPDEAEKIVRVENDDFFLKPVSRTFHGRDIFASVAAHLAKGEVFESFGPSVDNFDCSVFPKMDKKILSEGGIEFQGEIVHIDTFGNLITNIRIGHDIKVETVECAKKVLKGLKNTYGEVEHGQLTAIIGSSGFLEIAANQLRAQDVLGVKCGEKVYVKAVLNPK